MALEKSLLQFALGSYEVVVFNDFTNSQPLSRLVTGVPEARVKAVLSELGLPTGAVSLDTNVMMLSMGETRILIDTGWGSQGCLRRGMRTAGIERAEIDLVILTHPDGDHTGGLLDAKGSLAFPNAHYAMTRPAWDLWTSEHSLRRLPEDRAAFVEKVTALLSEKTRLLHVGAEIVPGVRFVDAPGHRQGHAAVEISSNREKLLHVADAVLHPLFVIHPSWQSPIDSDPAEAAETRQLLLSRAADSQVLIASAHLPFPGLGHIKAQGEGWLWRPITQGNRQSRHWKQMSIK